MNICEEHRGVRGQIELFRQLPQGPEEILAQGNTILNGAADLMAKAVAGQLLINGMYFAYDNDGPPFDDTSPPPKERTATFYHTDGGGTRNFVRAATLAQPSFDASDTQYNHNKVVFVAVTDGGGELPGAGNILTDGLSQFYGAALGWLSPDGYTEDLLFSAIDFDDIGAVSHFQQIAGAQLGIRWSIFFTIP